MASKAAMISQTLGANIAESMTDTQADKTPIRLAATPSKLEGVSRFAGAMMLPVSKLTPDPNQPRKEFDPEAITRLAVSIRNRGLLQPIRVRWDDPTSSWVIVAGERRWRASMVVGMDKIPAVEAKDAQGDDILADQLVENCLREDLSPVEQAKAMKSLLESSRWTQTRLADELGLSKGHVSRILALLRAPEDVQEQVTAGELSIESAVVLSRVKPEKVEQVTREGRGVKAVLAAAEDAGLQTRRRVSSRNYEVLAGTVTVKITDPRADDAAFADCLRLALTQAEDAVD